MNLSRTRTGVILTTAALAGLGLAVAPAAHADTPAPARTPVYNGCANPLPGAVVGAPAGYRAGAKSAVFDGSKTGVTVWHDKKGWHLRATHNEPKTTTTAGKTVNSLVTFEGRIVSSRPHAPVRGYALEFVRGHRDAFWVQQPGRRVVGFRFMNYAGLDGLDFANGCAGKVTIDVWRTTRATTTNPDGTTTTTVTRSPVKVWTGAASTLATDATAGDNRTTVVVLRTKKA